MFNFRCSVYWWKESVRYINYSVNIPNECLHILIDCMQPALHNLLQRVVRFFQQRSSCTTTHISAVVQRITLNKHDDLGRKNQTIQYILPSHWLYEWFSQFHSWGTYSVLSRSYSELITCEKWFWPSDLLNQLGQGQSKSNQSVAGLCPTFPKIS